MKGLLRKDIYELWAQGRTLFFLIALYLVLGKLTTGLDSVAMLLAAMLPTNCIGYDERTKWPRYALSMPVSVRDLVVSKYLLGYGALLCAAALRAVVMYLPFGNPGGWDGLAVGVSISLLYSAVQLPILFRCGTERGRIWMIVLSAGFAVLIVTLGTGLLFEVSTLRYLPWILLGLALALQFPSILLSTKLYRVR